MPTPRASVLINNFNYAPYVGRAIESALAQTAPDIEIVVVDDGSTDGSRQVLEAYGDRVTLVFQENGGQARAMTAGVRASRGEVLCFLDADDWWAPGKVDAVLRAFDADPQATLVYHRLQPMLSDGTPVMKTIPRTLCSGDLAPRMSRSGGWWPFPMTTAVSVRRSAWDAAGDIPDAFRISADAWLVGVYPFLGRVVALPEALGFYRVHNNTWFRAQDDAAMLRKRITHWKRTVDLTNDFLSRRGAPWRLNEADHFPMRVAEAKLNGASPSDRLALAALGLRFGGEPNLPRRIRDTLRVLRDLRPEGLAEADAAARS